MFVGLYARVSTKDKEQNPENQLIRLMEYCKSRNWDYREYVDFASGAKKDRPRLKSVMNDLNPLDGIPVLRLARFGRSLQNLPVNLLLHFGKPVSKLHVLIILLSETVIYNVRDI